MAQLGAAATAAQTNIVVAISRPFSLLQDMTGQGKEKREARQSKKEERRIFERVKNKIKMVNSIMCSDSKRNFRPIINH